MVKKMILISLSLASTLAFADVKTDLAKIDSTLKSCLNDPQNLSEAGMKVCTGTAYEAADKILNKQYQSIVNPLKGSNDKESQEILKRVRASEIAWINFRKAESDLQGTTDLGGSNETLDVLSSLYDLTTQRVKSLDLLFGRQK